MYDLSFVIPVFNCEKYIKQCLDSIIDQIGSNKIEVIVVNDCSTDNSLKIINNYSKFEFVNIIDLKKNAGVSNARNIGIENVHGEYIFFLDGDDLLIPGSINIMMNYIKGKKYDVIRFSHKKFFKGISFSKYKYHSSGIINIQRKHNIEVFNSFLNNYDFYSSCGQLISSKCVSNNRFNIELVLGEDMNFNLFMYFTLENIYIDLTPILYYRVNIGSVTRKYDIDKVIKKALSCYDAYNNLHLFDINRNYAEKINEKIVDNIVSIFSELYVNDIDNFENIYVNFEKKLGEKRPKSKKVTKLYDLDYIKKRCSKLKKRIVFHRIIKSIISKIE